MDAKEFEAELADVETRMERVKALYEQYFQGLERTPPAVARKDLDRRLLVLRRARPRSTAHRFRFQTLWQRYTTFQRYWTRICRQIEEGTYRRHVQRAQLRKQKSQRDSLQKEQQARDAAKEAAENASLPASNPDKSVSTVFARPSASEPPPRRAPVVRNGSQPRAANSAATADDARMRGLYKDYVDARARNNERVDNVRFETVEKGIRSMLPKLQAKHKGKKIDFEVVVKNGRVGIKPVVK